MDLMRNFGALNSMSSSGYGGWLKASDPDHERYKQFLIDLKKAFDAKGLYRKRDATYQMYLHIGQGHTPKKAQQLSKTKGYAPPVYSDFMQVWKSSRDMPTVVAQFAGDSVSTDGSVATEDGPTLGEMIRQGQAEGTVLVQDAQTGQFNPPSGGPGGPGGFFANRQGAAAEESFFDAYKVPLILGGAVGIAGLAYYLFVVRK